MGAHGSGYGAAVNRGPVQSNPSTGTGASRAHTVERERRTLEHVRKELRRVRERTAPPPPAGAPAAKATT